MLKIKDNVDLKELYKFGYKYYGNWTRGEVVKKEIAELKDKGDGISINFDIDRKIEFLHPYLEITYPNIELYIQDLIKAGLVEKVEER